MTHPDDKAAVDPLIAAIVGGDQQALARAGEAQAAASLRRLMDEQDSPQYDLDDERLIRAARALQAAGYWFTPTVALAWLRQHPGHRSLGVVLSLLLVSWTRAPEGPPPDPAQVEALLAVYDSLPYDVISENSLMLVLVRASRSGLPASLAAQVRARIARARATPGREPVVREVLDAYLDAPPG